MKLTFFNLDKLNSILQSNNYLLHGQGNPIIGPYQFQAKRYCVGKFVLFPEKKPYQETPNGTITSVGTVTYCIENAPIQLMLDSITDMDIADISSIVEEYDSFKKQKDCIANKYDNKVKFFTEHYNGKDSELLTTYVSAFYYMLKIFIGLEYPEPWGFERYCQNLQELTDFFFDELLPSILSDSFCITQDLYEELLRRYVQLNDLVGCVLS